MQHKIEEAALDAGFISAKPATAHPFELWRKKLDELPLGKRMKMEHVPQAVSGWLVSESTAWAALYPAPPFSGWPEGHGQVSGYYIGSHEARRRAGLWGKAVSELGYEVVVQPKLPARAIAIRACLGVHGLNGLLITPYGSFVYIAVLLVRSPPPEGAGGPGADISPGCGNCGKCIDACPAGAISENGVDALACLSNSMYHQSSMPEGHYPQMGARVRGCDECQLVCPCNAHVEHLAPNLTHTEPFALERLLAGPDLDAIGKLIGNNYAKKSKIQTQAVLAAANTGRKDFIPILRQHMDSDYEPLRKAAKWALEELER